MKAQVSQRLRRSRQGFSLIEVTFSMMQALALAGTVVLMLGQHVSFLRVVHAFDFLRDEAPAMNVLLGKIIRQADTYRIFSSKADAVSGTGAVTSGGSAVWLRFRNPDGSFAESVVAFETADGSRGLHIYQLKGTNWDSTPDWTISSLPQQVTFANDTGVLLVNVTGPNGEEVTYVGSSE